MTHRRVVLEVYAAQSPAARTPVARAALSRLDHKALALLAPWQEGLFGPE